MEFSQIIKVFPWLILTHFIASLIDELDYGNFKAIIPNTPPAKEKAGTSAPALMLKNYPPGFQVRSASSLFR